MTDILQYANVILLIFIWLRIDSASGSASNSITASIVQLGTNMDELNERLQTIEERLKDNGFKTDIERQREADLEP